MALLERDASDSSPKPRDADTNADTNADTSALARVMCEFEQLVLDLERGLQRSLEDPRTTAQHGTRGWCRQDLRREACRMAVSDLSDRYARKHISRSLDAAESEGKRVEELLHSLSLTDGVDVHDELAIHNGYFRLYSTELFDMLGQPTNLRFGTLRFHRHDSAPAHHQARSNRVTVELALNESFFIADSDETLPYHTFRMPTAPSLQNRGLLSRRPDDHGAFPDFDSWLLFTFLGNGCLKLEVPIEMCANVYGSRLQGRENEEVTFWGFFVDDDIDS